MKCLRTAVVLAVIFGQFLFSAEQSEQLTYKQVFGSQSRSLLEPLPGVRGWFNDSHYLLREGAAVFKVNARNRRKKPVFDQKALAGLIADKIGMTAPAAVSDDYRNFCFIKKQTLYLALLKEKKLLKISEHKMPVHNPRFSPDGQRLAFTRGGNLFCYEIADGKLVRLTTDGSKDILNGYASWVYYEEILGRSSRYCAFWWSPDSKKISFLRFDQSLVPVFNIVCEKGTYGELTQQRYPKPGYPNPQVRLGIAEIDSKNITWIDKKDSGDHYLAFPRWTADSSELYYQWLNRKQNHLKLFAYAIATGKSEQVYEETSNTWVEFMTAGDLQLLKNGEMIIRSSRDKWPHLYLLSKKNGLQQLTSGDWSVSGVSHVNEKRKKIYFTGNLENPLQNHLFVLNLKNRSIQRITRTRGTHTISFSPGGSYFLDYYSSLDSPPKMDLKNRSGGVIRVLGRSETAALKKYLNAGVEKFWIETSDHVKLPAIWYLPPDFSESATYPVVIKIYGGPGAGSVADRFPRSLANYYMAQKGIIVMSVDHRGAGHHGRKGMDLMYRNLGKWELNDYCEAVKFLHKKPFVDKKRIGISGGSYGGYVSALALVRKPEFFNYGIASFSVTDWALYDSVYTERFMDTPEANPRGYSAASVLNGLENYRGGLMIIHGTMDDNVHMQNSIKLIKNLQDRGKSFEFMLYPGGRHGFRGNQRAHFQRESLNFWFDKFFQKKFTE